MEVNTLKTEFQLFTLSTRSHSVSLSLGGSPLRQTTCATYLGVKLDSRLTWNAQVECSAQKGNKRLGLLKRLTGMKWGASQDVLTLAYKSYVRPSIEYGSELMVTASAATVKKLDVTQNHALRLITGGAVSAPIAAMELQTGIEPQHYRRDSAALMLTERLQRADVEYWKTYTPAVPRLSTQTTFLAKVESLKNEYGLTQFPQNPEQFPSAVELVPRRTALHYTTLTSPVSKLTTPPIELKSIALETIHTRFPESEWLRVYTDGSATGARRNGGAGVYSSARSIAAPVGVLASNFDGEIRAVLLALEMLTTTNCQKCVILCDSQAAIVSLCTNGCTASRDVLKGRKLIEQLLDSGVTVALQWIPSHVGIWGNERADALAKEGSQMDMPNAPVSFLAAKSVTKASIHGKLQDAHRQAAEGKQWATLLNPGERVPQDLPRHESVAAFRALTGHDYLNAHLHRLRLSDDPSCTLCSTNATMTSDHLFDCPRLGDIRQAFEPDETKWSKFASLYWAAKGLMAEEP